MGTTHPNLVIVSARGEVAPVGGEAQAGDVVVGVVIDKHTGASVVSAGEMRPDWRGGSMGIKRNERRPLTTCFPRWLCHIYAQNWRTPPRCSARRARSGRCPCKCGVSTELLDGQQTSNMNPTGLFPAIKPQNPNQQPQINSATATHPH
jgi:hypothetical protein